MAVGEGATRTNNRKSRSRGKGRSNDRRNSKSDRQYDKKIVSIRRVTRVYKGGKRMRLSVLVVVGDKKGKIGAGIGRGADVRSAEEKAYKQAVKNIVEVPIAGNTINHEITHKRGAARIFLKPAAPGTGLIAGGSVRPVLELAGVKDVLSKIIGTNNKISNVYATIEALKISKVK